MTLEEICKVYGVNEEQARALNIDQNTALRAGAGSGKTRVLTKRFVKCLLENPNLTLDNVVAITFTKKAATQMKDRIRRELTDRISEISEADEKKRLTNIKMQITNANIDTIHGFCGKLLQDHFYFLGLDPEFQILEEVDMSVRLSAITDEVIKDFIEAKDNDEEVRVIAENFSVGFFMGKLKQGIISALQDIREKGIDLPEAWQNLKTKHMKDVIEVKEAKDISNIAKGDTGETANTGNVSEKVNTIDMVKINDTDNSHNINNLDPTTVLENIALKLVINLDSKYRVYKENENLLDFSDIEILTEGLLRNVDIRESYSNRFKIIMVDEFQDVNPLQKRILDHLTFIDGEIPAGRLFIVGDHKQSIYGFRGSDYRVFEEACDEISRFGKVEYLNNCYRSTKNIINTVNSVFKNLLDPYEVLNYPKDPKNPKDPKYPLDTKDKDKSLNNKEKEKKVELITWEKEELKEKKPKTRWDSAKNLLLSEEKVEELKLVLEAKYEDPSSAGKKNYQGDVIADTIKKLLFDGFKHSDIAILLRSRTSLLEIENSLTTNEIPYCVLGGIGFWDRQEVNDILALYKLVFSPDDKLALFSVLRSPIFGFSDDMLLEFSIFMREVTKVKPHELMEAFTGKAPDDEKWLIRRAADILSGLLPIKGVLNSLELLNRILTLTAYDEILAALPQGEKKLRNIEKLIRIVEEFEAKGVYSARELLAYLDTLKESSGMDGEAFLDNEDSNAVKILTIHASKGLEFGAVLIPDMDRLLDSQAKRNKPLFFFDEQKGLVAMGLDENLKLNESVNPEYEKRYNEKLLREMEDSRRLFYVAATRAKEYLGFIGEKQEVKTKDDTMSSLNSFMKQLVWAMDKEETKITCL